MEILSLRGKQFKGVIFDLDGTLIDSNESHALAWRLALAKHGIERPYMAIRRLVGMGGDKLLPAVASIDIKSDEGKRINQTRAEIFERDFLAKIRAIPGTHDLLQELKNRGIKLAIATSGSRRDLNALLAQTKIDARLFEGHLICADGQSSKPDPDIVLQATRDLKLAHDYTVMIGDTPYDHDAAHGAGVAFVAMRCGGYWPDKAFFGALTVVDGPLELLDRMRSHSAASERRL